MRLVLEHDVKTLNRRLVVIITYSKLQSQVFRNNNLQNKPSGKRLNKTKPTHNRYKVNVLALSAENQDRRWGSGKKTNGAR